MSRASSGFESGHLPPSSPELHLSTSAGNSVENPDLPCTSASVWPQTRSINLPTGPTATRAISRSQSCSELRGNAASQSLRRSLSLNLLCKDQKRVNNHLDNQSASSTLKTDGSAQDLGNVPDDHQVGSPSSSQPPATQHSGLQEPVKATHSEERDAVQCAVPQPESDVYEERSDLPPLTAPIVNPHEDAIPTETSSVCLTNRVVSANIEARRLKMRRDKKNSVKVHSLTEEDKL